MANLIAQVGLGNTFANDTQMTVFAPTDAAVATLAGQGIDLNQYLLGDPTAIYGALLYHTIGAKVRSEQFTPESRASLIGEELCINVVNGEARVGLTYFGEATIEVADIEATNGVVHVIDTGEFFFESWKWKSCFVLF